MINVRFVKPLDTELLDQLAKNHTLLVTIEENVESGGFGEHVVSYFSEKQTAQLPKVIKIAINDLYVEHGNVEILKKELGLDVESVLKRIVAGYIHE